MVLKNVKDVHFWQVDHKIKKIVFLPKNIILPSKSAWEKFKWVRKYFEKKPKEGYFVWIKREVDFPLNTCINVASPKISQDLENLLVVEKGIKLKANILCSATEKNLCAIHKARGKIILKKDAFLEYNHLHIWGKKDFVNPEYEFVLERNSKLIYNYKNLFPPENLFLKTLVEAKENSVSNLNIIVNGLNSKVEIIDEVNLFGKNSQAIVRLRLVGRENSQFDAKSTILAKNPSKGHLDCQGLIVEKSAKISLIPRLICEHKEAQLTHEASIGKISEDQLNYLRMRGLTEKEAIDLIVSGFLEK